MRARSLRQVTRRSVLCWHGKKIAARYGYGTLAVRRQVHRFDMFGCIDKRGAADRKIFLDLDRHRRCLTAREIVAPDVSRLLEHD